MDPQLLRVSSALVSWLTALSLAWVICLIGLVIWMELSAHGVSAHAIARPIGLVSPARRRFLATAGPVVGLAPIAMGCAGVVTATGRPVQREVSVPFSHLPKDLQGLRIAQLTDIHFGPFFGEKELRAAVAAANEMRPHIVALTGDLITRRGDDLEGCLEVLRGLRSDAGVYCTHGNHEMFAGLEAVATLIATRMGFRCLENQNTVLRFGEARLNLAGVPYQPLGETPLEGDEDLVLPGHFNLLLSHTPAAFDRAADLGFDLTLSGHTHGGQINIAVGDRNVNVASAFTPYTYGLYRKPASALYVSGGLGTVALPVRLGVPPEVTLITLCGA